MSAYIARKVVVAFLQPKKNKATEEVLSAREMEVLELLAS